MSCLGIWEELHVSGMVWLPLAAGSVFMLGVSIGQQSACALQLCCSSHQVVQ